MTATHTIVFVVLVVSASLVSGETSAVDVLFSAYESCVRHGSFACVKPEVLAFIGEALGKDTVKITRDLSIVRTSDTDVGGVQGDIRAEIAAAYKAQDSKERRLAFRRLLLDGVDRYLQSHEIRVTMPQELVEATKSAEEGSLARTLAQDLPTELRMPLEESSQEVSAEAEVEARHKKRPLHHLLHKKKHRKGFLKQVIIPFLLGLKFKATALVPLALSLIALKTWKALTLGLLSLVLSGAMVIFRFTKPKVVNYEVYHYPQSGHHVDHYDHHGYARNLAYSAYRP